MSDVKHTPGPWTAREQKNRSGIVIGWIVEAENGDRIGWPSYANAESNEGDRAPFATTAANARLIAAAPDMLAALKHVDERVIGPSPDEPLLHPDISEAWRVVRAAIAKAEGML
jgi:hypothetical protein